MPLGSNPKACFLVIPYTISVVFQRAWSWAVESIRAWYGRHLRRYQATQNARGDSVQSFTNVLFRELADATTAFRREHVNTSAAVASGSDSSPTRQRVVAISAAADLPAPSTQHGSNPIMLIDGSVLGVFRDQDSINGDARLHNLIFLAGNDDRCATFRVDILHENLAKAAACGLIIDQSAQDGTNCKRPWAASLIHGRANDLRFAVEAAGQETSVAIQSSQGTQTLGLTAQASMNPALTGQVNKTRTSPMSTTTGSSLKQLSQRTVQVHVSGDRERLFSVGHVNGEVAREFCSWHSVQNRAICFEAFQSRTPSDARHVESSSQAAAVGSPQPAMYYVSNPYMVYMANHGWRWLQDHVLVCNTGVFGFVGAAWYNRDTDTLNYDAMILTVQMMLDAIFTRSLEISRGRTFP